MAERETIIRTSEADKTYSIYTYNQTLQRNLNKLAAEHPKICKRISYDEEWGDATYVVAKDNVNLGIHPKREMSAAQRAAAEQNKDKRLEALRRGREKQKAQRSASRQDK